MDDAVRDKLISIIRPEEGGKPQIPEAKRLAAMLKDLCPEQKAEAHVLTCALKIRAPRDLMAAEKATFDIVLSRLVERLELDFYIDSSAAGWAVETWAVACGVMRADDAGRRVWERERPDDGDDSWDEGEQAEAPKPTVAVSPEGRDKFTRISDALAACQNGHRILVRPGTYRESLRIDKDVDIVGDGVPEEIVLESWNFDGITMATPTARLKNLTIRGRIQQGHDLRRSGAAAVHIPMGNLKLINCQLSSEGPAVALIHGKESTPEFEQCLFLEGPGRGLYCADMAAPKFTDCDISGQTGPGVEIRQWAKPSFERCRVRLGKVNGVMVTDYGLGTFTECEIYENWLSGFFITGSGNPTVERCVIRLNRNHGVWIAEKGEGAVRFCKIVDNARGSVFVESGCKPRLFQNETK